MKSLFEKLNLNALLIAAMSSAIALSPAALAHDRDTGGGDPETEAKFINFGRMIGQSLVPLGSQIPELNVKRFQDVVERCSVKSHPLVFDKGVPKPAINYGPEAKENPCLIEVSQLMFPGLSREDTMLIVAHEYASVLGLVDQRYYYSSRIVNLLKAANLVSDVRTCGLQGNVLERIADCQRVFGDLATRRAYGAKGSAASVFSSFDSVTPFVWRLVSRTGSQKVLWRDDATGTIWTELYPVLYDRMFERSSAFCMEQSKIDYSGTGLTLALPSDLDYQAALSHGAREILGFGAVSNAWIRKITKYVVKVAGGRYPQILVVPKNSDKEAYASVNYFNGWIHCIVDSDRLN